MSGKVSDADEGATAAHACSTGTRLELSGGDRRRVAIDGALPVRPELLSATKYPSALDPSVEAAVVELVEQLTAEMGLSRGVVPHDLALVASVSDGVLVLELKIQREKGVGRTPVSVPADPNTSG